MANMMNEENITTDPTAIKRIIGEYYINDFTLINLTI